MKELDPEKARGVRARAKEFERYDQVAKPDYCLAEGGGEETVVEDHHLKACELARFLSGDPADKRRFARELGEAMEEIGFAVLVEHGIDPRRIDAAQADTRALFEGTTHAERLRFRAARHGSISQGYFPIAETSNIHPDLVEGWVFCRRAFDLDADPAFDPRAFWPDPAFEPRLRGFAEAGVALFRPIQSAILLHLGQDERLFDAKLAAPNFGLRLNYYPPLSPEELASGAGRLLGHEDVDLFTLLPAPAIEGLQALRRDGVWVRLHAPPGSIILNTGDYLQRISNDVLPSTTHRVSPPRDAAQRALVRTSTPLAAYLWEDEVLEVLPGLGPPKYEPIKALTFHTRTTAKFYGDAYAVEG